jgi:hypothetical protein
MNTSKEKAIVESMGKFMEGASPLPPQDVIKMLINGHERLSQSMAFMMFMSMPRIANKLRFINETEGIIYNPDTVMSLSDAEVLDRNKSAQDSVIKEMTFINNFLAKNGEMLNRLGAAAGSDIEYLKDIPHEKLSKLVKKIKDGEVPLD